jgi:hypothetical protein
MGFTVYDIWEKFGFLFGKDLMPVVRGTMPQFVVPDHWMEFAVGIISSITFMN